ncbi:Protein required for attachment to host cell [compost metagenome]
MLHQAFPLHILVDGASARPVRRAQAPHRFEMVETLDHASALDALRARIGAHPSGATHESAEPGSHRMGREDRGRLEKAEFMNEVADRAVRLATSEEIDQVVIVAPPRLAPVLCRAIGGRLTISGELHHDLIKVADPDLEAWLSPEARLPND